MNVQNPKVNNISSRASSRSSKLGSVSSETDTNRFEDFILIAEFSEQIGPTPVLCIPECCPQNFNQIAFAVRVLSVDWHLKVSSSDEPLSRFSLEQDVQMLLSEPKESAEAVVSYMTVYDLHARGNERPYCFCYVSQDRNKMLLFFEDIMKALANVVTLIHKRNYEVFLKDLKSHSNLLQKDMKLIKSEGLPKTLPPGVTPESAVEDITSHLQDMTSLIEDLDHTLEQFNSETITTLHGHRIISRSHSDTLKRCAGRFSKRVNSDLKLTHTISPNTLLSTSPTYTLSTITSSVRNFDRKLRSLPELVSMKMWGDIRRALDDIVNLYRQDTSLLLLNRYDAACLKPSSSLLTCGQFAVSNFIPPEKPVSKHRTVKAAETVDSQPSSSQDQVQHFSKVWSVKNSAFANEASKAPMLFPEKKQIESTRTAGSFSPSSFSSLESVEGPSHTHPNSSSLSSDSPGLAHARGPAREEPVGPNTDDQVLSINPLGYNIIGDSAPLDNNQELLSYEGSDSIEGSDDYSTPPESAACHNTHLHILTSPVLFTSAMLRPSSRPSYDLKAQLYRTPNLIHVVFSMLSGKPVMCECPTLCEMETESLLRNFSLFLPGSAHRHHILTATDRASLLFSALNCTKLAMVKSRNLLDSKQYSLVRRHSQVFAVRESAATFHGHQYEGDLLSMFSKSFLTRQRTFPLNNEFLVSLFQSVLLQLSMKAYLLFHHSLSTRHNVTKSGEALKRSLSLSSSDWEIIKYFSKVIREQIIEQFEREIICKSNLVTECVPSCAAPHVTPMLTLLGYEESQCEETAMTFTSTNNEKK